MSAPGCRVHGCAPLLITLTSDHERPVHANRFKIYLGIFVSNGADCLEINVSQITWESERVLPGRAGGPFSAPALQLVKHSFKVLGGARGYVLKPFRMFRVLPSLK